MKYLLLTFLLLITLISATQKGPSIDDSQSQHFHPSNPPPPSAQFSQLPHQMTAFAVQRRQRFDNQHSVPQTSVSQHSARHVIRFNPYQLPSPPQQQMNANQQMHNQYTQNQLGRLAEYQVQNVGESIQRTQVSNREKGKQIVGSSHQLVPTNHQDLSGISSIPINHDIFKIIEVGSIPRSYLLQTPHGPSILVASSKHGIREVFESISWKKKAGIAQFQIQCQMAIDFYNVAIIKFSENASNSEKFVVKWRYTDHDYFNKIWNRIKRAERKKDTDPFISIECIMLENRSKLSDSVSFLLKYDPTQAVTVVKFV